jgi:hypothetical protein
MLHCHGAKVEKGCKLLDGRVEKRFVLILSSKLSTETSRREHSGGFRLVMPDIESTKQLGSHRLESKSAGT